MLILKLRINHNEKGFTLIELMIVIAIISILAAIAIPNFIAYRRRGYNSAANSDIKNAYTAAQANFQDYPTGAVSTTILENYGFKSTRDVTLTVSTNNVQSNLSMTSAHGSGDKTYRMDSDGDISF